MLEAADAAPPVELERVDLVTRLLTRGLQSQVEGPVGHPDAAEQDLLRGALRALRRNAEAEQLFDVQSAALVLHDVEHGSREVQLEQHDPSGSEIERVVARLDPAQRRHQRAVGIEYRDV